MSNHYWASGSAFLEVAGGGRKLPAPQVPFLSDACTNNLASERPVSAQGNERGPLRCAQCQRAVTLPPTHAALTFSLKVGLPGDCLPQRPWAAPPWSSPAPPSLSLLPKVHVRGCVLQSVQMAQPHALWNPKRSAWGTLSRSLKLCHFLQSCSCLGL